MKAPLLFIILIATLHVSAQGHRLGYHRSDGSYVVLQDYTFSEGYVYDSWSCNENKVSKKRNISKRNADYYRKSNPDRVTNRHTYSRPSNTSYTYYNNYPSNKYYNDSKYSTHYVTTESLNVRSGPSSKHKLVGTLSYAESVSVIDSYSNGWKKIQYSHFDTYSSSFRTKYGYVAGNYLSKSKPYSNYDFTYNNYTYYDRNYTSYNRNNNSYNRNYNSYNSNVYSSINKVEPDYGVGGLTIWTNCATDGDIIVYIDDVYVGVLTQSFTNRKPDCDEPGTLFIEKKAGKYKLVAKGDQNTWSGTITITKNKCLIQGLE